MCVSWEPGEGEQREEENIKGAKQKITTSSADTKPKGTPQAEASGSSEWAEWEGLMGRFTGRRLPRTSQLGKLPPTHVQWVLASVMRSYGSQISLLATEKQHLLLLHGTKQIPRSLFALSTVPDPGNIKMNKLPGDSECHRETDLGTYKRRGQKQ